MTPPNKTTLVRMQQTALEEMERIQIVQDYWVRDGAQQSPNPGQLLKRDDFAGIVRLIDIIQTDAVMLDRLKVGMARASIARVIEVTADAEVEPE